MLICRFLCGYLLSALLGKYQGVQLLDHIVGIEIVKLSSQVAVPHCILTSNECEFLLFPHPCQDLVLSVSGLLVRTSLVAQMVENLPALWQTWVQSLGWEDPLEEACDKHVVVSHSLICISSIV